MKKILIVLITIFIVVILALLFLIKSPVNPTVSNNNMEAISVASDIANKISNLISPTFSLTTLINQNSKVIVSISAGGKFQKFMADKFPNATKPSIIISSDPFVVGVNDYWTNSDGSQTFFGGTSVNFDKDNSSINLAISVDAIKNAGWSEEDASKYLEYKLYLAAINSQQTQTTDTETEAKNYLAEISRQFPENLFNVKYVN